MITVGAKHMYLAVLGGVVALVMVQGGIAKATTTTGDGTLGCLVSGKTKVQLPFVGGTGTYSLGQFAALCTATGNKKGSDVAAVVSLDISSNGIFENTICGTGSADDYITVVDAVEVEGNAEGAIESMIESAD